MGYWVIGLLGCWVIGLWGYGVVGLWGCWVMGFWLLVDLTASGWSFSNPPMAQPFALGVAWRAGALRPLTTGFLNYCKCGGADLDDCTLLCWGGRNGGIDGLQGS